MVSSSCEDEERAVPTRVWLMSRNVEDFRCGVLLAEDSSGEWTFVYAPAIADWGRLRDERLLRVILPHSMSPIVYVYERSRRVKGYGKLVRRLVVSNC